MSESPSRKKSTEKPASSNQTPLTYHEKYSTIASRKIEQCKRFLTFARYLQDRGMYAKSSAGLSPSSDDNEDLAALRQQWQDLLDNKLLEGASDVLMDSFLDEAKVELAKADEDREAWRQVLDLVQQCQAVKQDLDKMFADVQSA